MRITILLSCVLLAVCSSVAFGQNCTDPAACNFNPDGGDYCVQTEVHFVHTDGPLQGMTTYRVYVLTDTPEDRVSAVFGDDLFPLTISTTTSFYQDPLGAATPNGINPILFSAFPDLVYDSWVTVGIEQVPLVGEGNVSTVQDGVQPWVTDFENGQNIEINTSVGGAWYVTSDISNGLAGDDLKVLIGQFTTDGELSGTINVAVFPEGVQEEGSPGDVGIYEIGVTCACEYPTTMYVDGDGDGYGGTAVTVCPGDEGNYVAIGGDCNDNTSIAFPGNPNEIVGDGIDGDCDGGEVCYRDVDNDGYRSADETDVVGSPENVNCSEIAEAYVYEPIDCDDTNPDLTEADADGNCITLPTGTEGCGDPLACNYDPEVPAEEDNCEFLSCQGCPNPGACNYDADALIPNVELCEFLSCAGCTDPTATNYNSEAVISDDSDCIYTGALASGPVSTNYNATGAGNGTYTSDVYAMLPPEAIQLNRVFGIKGGDIRLRFLPFEDLYQAASCDVWNPADMTPDVDVDGVTYTNPDCMEDSWFTLGGGPGYGPALNPIGFDPLTFASEPEFDSEMLAMEGDTLGWELIGDTGGEVGNHCTELLDQPGCANSVRIARVTLPLGQTFLFQAGVTYTVPGEGERSLTVGTVTDAADIVVGGSSCDSDNSIADSGSGEDDEYITDGTPPPPPVYGCLEEFACNYDPDADTENGSCQYDTCSGCTAENACNYDPDATIDSGACEYSTCAGCTYPDAENYAVGPTLDDGSCTFAPEPSPCPSDLNGDGLIGAGDLTQLLASYNGICE